MNIRQAIRNRIPIFNKYILNRLTRYLAAISFGPFAIVRHVGRRSGKRYETPIFVFRIVDGFIVVLTYGPNVDWYRNVVAANHCAVIWHRKEFDIVNIEPTDSATALPALPPPIKLILGTVGVHDFVKMNASA